MDVLLIKGGFHAQNCAVRARILGPVRPLPPLHATVFPSSERGGHCYDHAVWNLSRDQRDHRSCHYWFRGDNPTLACAHHGVCLASGVRQSTAIRSVRWCNSRAANGFAELRTGLRGNGSRNKRHTSSLADDSIQCRQIRPETGERNYPGYELLGWPVWWRNLLLPVGR